MTRTLPIWKVKLKFREAYPDSLTPADSDAEDEAPCSKRAKIMFEESCSEDSPTAEETVSESEFEPPPKQIKTTAEVEPQNLRGKYHQSSQ